ncbi:MAG: pyruvate dehydrogenase (acetyl-transferring) E1 component subunit alpha [Candidatus Micrarchaeaceae archaeon]
MITESFNCSIKYLQIMNEDGEIDQTLIPQDITDSKILEMYKGMVLARAVDAKVLSLQRQGRAVTYAPLLGEEATQIGTAMAMRKQDIFVPAFRQHGVFIERSVPIDALFIYWRGFEEGNVFPKEVNAFPIIVPVATQMPHATGIAFAQRYLKKDSAVLVYVGDGGTSEGDFYEAINFAGVWKVPLITIIENNQWAISLPRNEQTSAKTLAQKGVAVGIDSIQVDGNDVLAVYKATRDAIANSNKGPMIIECITYRMGLHTTSDDPTKYRSDSEVEAWKRKDPIERVKKYLIKKGVWDEIKEQQELEAVSKLVDNAVEKAEKFKPDPRSMFSTVYSFMPQVLRDEFDEAEANNFWQ